MLPRTSSIWQRDSHPTASGKPGAVQMERMCDTSPCTMEGPLRFTLGLKDGTKHTFEAGPGERMRVEMVGTRVRCSDL